MQVGSLHVFPRANKREQHCSTCNVVLLPKTAYVHHYKVQKINGIYIPEHPSRPSVSGFGGVVYTAQLYFCSYECITLRALKGVYCD